MKFLQYWFLVPTLTLAFHKFPPSFFGTWYRRVRFCIWKLSWDILRIKLSVRLLPCHRLLPTPLSSLLKIMNMEYRRVVMTFFQLLITLWEFDFISWTNGRSSAFPSTSIICRQHQSFFCCQFLSMRFLKSLSGSICSIDWLSSVDHQRRTFVSSHRPTFVPMCSFCNNELMK